VLGLATVATPPGITASFDPVSGTLTLSGSATPAAYQQALRAVTYANTSESPSNAQRTVTFTAEDGQATDSATRNVQVVPVNDPPVAVDDAGATGEDAPLNVAAPGLLANDTDPDAGDTRSAVQFTGTSAKGAAVTINTNGSYSYDPGSHFQSLDAGQTDTDTFTYTVKDAAQATDTATVTITITGAADAPVANDDAFNAVGNSGLFVGKTRPAGQPGRQITGSVLANDADPDTPALTVTPLNSAPTANGGTVTLSSDGTFSYMPPTGSTATDSFGYTAGDGTTTDTATVTISITGRVWYVRNDFPGVADGRSATPFTTLAAADTAADAIGDTIYVLRGSGTTGLSDTVDLLAQQRLVGEAVDLVAGNTTLFTGTPANRPPLSGTINLDDGDTISGIAITGGFAQTAAIAGNSGDVSGTIADVQASHLVNGPCLQLGGTSGTWEISDFSASARGISINNAGTVNFAPQSAVTIDSASGQMLAITDTSVTGQIDSATGAASYVSGFAEPVAVFTRTSGDLVIDDLKLTLSSSFYDDPALSLVDAGGITINATGDADIASSSRAVQIQGGPATQPGAPDVHLDQVVGGSNVADYGAQIVDFEGTFSAAGGMLKGFKTDLSVLGGSGSISYGGTLADNGTSSDALSAEVDDRTGGAVTVSGDIIDGADVGGGIRLIDDAAGTITFSGSSKHIDTGGSLAISATNGVAGAADVAFTNGGLSVSSNSGAPAVSVANTGSFSVTGANNAISNASGTALAVTDTDIGAAGLTFHSIVSAGTANPGLDGITLSHTGDAGGLTVTGDGTNARNGSGGTIQSRRAGLALTDVHGVSLNSMQILDTANSGITGTGVTDFSFTNGTLQNSGDAAGESNIAFDNGTTGNGDNLDGTLVLTGSMLANGFSGGLDVHSKAGTINNATITGNTVTNPGLGGLQTALGGIVLKPNGDASGAAAVTKATISQNTITGARNSAVAVVATGQSASGPGAVAGTPGDASKQVAISGNAVTLDPSTQAQAILAVVSGNNPASRTVGNLAVSGNGTNANPVVGSPTAMDIAVFNSGFATMTADVSNNVVDANQVVGGGSFGIGVINGGTGPGSYVADLTASVNGNKVTDSFNSGILLRAGGTAGMARLTANGNTVGVPLGSSWQGMRVEAGGTNSTDDNVCLTMTGNASSGNGIAGIGIRKLGSNATVNDFGIQGLTPSPATAAQAAAFLAAQNPSSTVAPNFDSGDNFVANSAVTPPAGLSGC
jgi:VCBS repeat-containing protein